MTLTMPLIQCHNKHEFADWLRETPLRYERGRSMLYHPAE